MSAPAGQKIPYTGLPTQNPNETIIPGQMRSDREELPEGFTKEDADRAEVREYELQQRQSAVARGPAPGPDCQQYWPSDKWVCGAIRDKYNSLGAQFSFLLWPTSDELVNPDGFGRRQTFTNGPIFWSAAGGAHPVVNHFFAAWARHGYEGGYIGYPTTDEIVNADGVGRRQEFTGAAIYWRLNEAYSIGGAIRDKWAAMGGENGALGYPTTDELPGVRHGGRYNDFTNGTVTWSTVTGAHGMYKTFRDKWATDNRQNGALGYPTSDEFVTPNGQGRGVHFESGSIYAKNSVPAFIIKGAIRDKWAAQGWEGGTYGFPKGDEYGLDGGQAQDFDGGTITANLGEQPSDFDPPVGPCPDAICADPQSVPSNDPAARTTTESSESSLPNCEAFVPLPSGSDPFVCKRTDPSSRTFAEGEGPDSEPPVASRRTDPPDDAVLQSSCYYQSPNWFTDRIYACRATYYYYDVLHPQTSNVMGYANVYVETEAQTYHNQKHTDFRHRYTVEETWAVMDEATISATPSCGGCETFTGPNHWTMIEGQDWYSEQAVDLETPAVGEIEVSSIVIDFEFRPSAAYSTAWKPMYEQDVKYPVIRCDQALTVGMIGCIYPSEIPLLPYYDPYNYGQLAGHIAAAQASGVPGDYEADLPLHKGTKDAETYNRDIACKSNPRVPPVRSERDCDEYPFASSREGAGFGGTERTFQGCGMPLVAQNFPNGSPITGPGYSICLIDPGHNRRGGADARWFYHFNRVLLDDPFYVDVMSGSLPTG